MNARLIGAIIALFVVVAVAVTSMRLISFSFQEQVIAETAQTTEPRRDVAENTGTNFGQVLAFGVPVEANPMMGHEWQAPDVGTWQAEPAAQRQEEERKLSETRRQAEQQRIREAQARETELSRGLEEQRKATEAWWKEEQVRRQREAAQLEADLRRVQDDERRLGVVRKPVEMRVQADKQGPSPVITPVKSEGKVAADRPQSESKVPAQKHSVAQAPSASAQPVTRPVHASTKKVHGPVCEFSEAVAALLNHPEPTKQAASTAAPKARVASADAPKAKVAGPDKPKLRGTNVASKPAKALTGSQARSSWQVQAFLQTQ